MEDSVAYWISPSGVTTPIITRHIHDIIGNPEKFGLTDKYVRSIYKKHKERIGQEGDAREEIMIELMKNGWIRCRQLLRGSITWTIQCYMFNKKSTKMILNWILDMAHDKRINGNTPLTIIDIKDGRMISSDMRDAVNTLGETIKKKKKVIA